MTTADPCFVIDAADERAAAAGGLSLVVVTVSVTSIGKLDNGPPADVSGKTCAGGPCSDARRHPLVTVEADQVLVESRLTAGGVPCPVCPGVLTPWGWARRREVRGVGTLQPRRARCSLCLVTHVLLPVTVLLRRADAAAVIWTALVARAAGHGHRTIAALVGTPTSTARGWLRRMSTRLEPVRVHFTVVTRRAGVDQAVPDAAGDAWRDVVAAVAAAWLAITSRFGSAGLVGTVTAAQVACASSGGRLLSPGWPRPSTPC
ncbi:MAG: hypothetical protein U0R23_00150 [Candidatus Nanopelagicales bacterium]